MYTVNKANFFGYGVDAGDAQFDVRVGLRVILLSIPIQFFGTPESELFAHFYLYAGAWLLHIL